MKAIFKEATLMEDVLTLKFWEPFLRVVRIDNYCPVRVLYGIPKDGSPLIHDYIFGAENILVFGTTGSGKTNFLNTFIRSASHISTVDDVRFVLVDSKRVDFNQYKESELLLYPVINKTSEFISKANLLIEEIERRKELIGETKFAEYREQINKQIPYILVVIDEYVDIANQEANRAVLDLLKEGYKYGVHVILSTQSISDYVADIGFFKSFKTIICQSNFDEERTKELIGDYQELEGSGDSLVLRNSALIHVQNLFTPYKADLTARIDEPVMSDEMWVFELLAKNNEEILVPVDENNEIIVKKKVVTIFNPQNYVKADICDKHRKVKMKFWTLLKMIRGKRFNIRLENNSSSYYSCRMYEGWYNQWWRKYKNEE